MKSLSNACAKGRIGIAGYPKLAVFFLFCLFVCSCCPANASGADDVSYPFVSNGKLYSFCADSDSPSLKACDIFGAGDGYSQRAVSVSKKKGYALAWNSKTKYLYHVNQKGHADSNVKLSGSNVYVNQKFVLAQSSSFDENEGFPFTLYSVLYSFSNKKISLKKLWNGSIDCFFSDCFFTDDGVCISGGTRDNSKNNVFYITKNGIHKCFTVAKNSDFLRIMNTGDSVYAFLSGSGRDDTSAEPVVYCFTLDSYIEGNNPQCYVNLNSSPLLPSSFECFFGYGFVTDKIVIPGLCDGVISFICYDYKNGSISSVVPDATGCIAVLGAGKEGTWYIAKNPLIEGSFYGISLFTGSECKKIKEIF